MASPFSNARFEFQGSNGTLTPAGVRVLASDQEFTDILYDPNAEELTINRGNSTLVPGCRSPFLHFNSWRMHKLI